MLEKGHFLQLVRGTCLLSYGQTTCKCLAVAGGPSL